MSEFQIGDRVRVIDTSAQKHDGLAVGDIATVTEVLTEPRELIAAFYGDLVPMFVSVDGKRCPGDPEGNWPVLSTEVEAVSEETAA